MKPMIIDTDPGVDDAMAIAYALCHPDVELLALTTVFGNVSVDTASRNAQYLLERFGASEVAVARGAGKPLERAPLPPADFVHGADGLGNCYPAAGASLSENARHARLQPLDAADFIIDCARRRAGEITLVAVGPLTNIALALQREPELPRLVHELVVMGGTVIEPGNVSPVAEANFLNDPHAADAVLTVDWPVTVVGLDVTHRIMLYNSHLANLREQAGSIGELIWDASRYYVHFYSEAGAARGGPEPGCAMHDAAAVACALMPDAFATHSGPARVVTEGVAQGQFVIDRRGGRYLLPYWQDRPASTTACMAVDAERVRKNFLDTLVKHHRV